MPGPHEDTLVLVIKGDYDALHVSHVRAREACGDTVLVEQLQEEFGRGRRGLETSTVGSGLV